MEHGPEGIVAMSGFDLASGRFVFFPEGAFGPTNNCVGIGTVLRERGHRVVFVIEQSFAGTLEEKGFEERLMRLAPPPEQEEEPGQFWKDFIRETAPVFRKSTFEQLSEFIVPTWEALLDGVADRSDPVLRQRLAPPGRPREGAPLRREGVWRAPPAIPSERASVLEVVLVVIIADMLAIAL